MFLVAIFKRKASPSHQPLFGSPRRLKPAVLFRDINMLAETKFEFSKGADMRFRIDVSSVKNARVLCEKEPSGR